MYDELTVEDINKMKEELDYRKKVVRPDLHEKILEAKENGDLSENADYRECRRAKGKNESRIEYLELMIKTAKIIKPKQNCETVDYGSKIEVLFEDDNEIETFEIATVIGQDAQNGKISKNSPFGKAVWGHKVGDKVKVEVSSDNYYFITIKSIS